VLYSKILGGKFVLPKTLSPELQDFIQRVLTVDPAKRIRVEAMKQHKWWKKYSNNYYP
jgi:serine/threonine protein kinase